MRRLVVLLLSAALTGLAATAGEARRAASEPAPPPTGESRSFRGWTIACDNIRSCTALSVSPQDPVGGIDPFALQVLRPAGPRGQAVIRLLPVEMNGEELPASLQLQIGREAPFPLQLDGESRVWVLPAASTSRFLAAARPASAAQVLASDGRELAVVTLSGLVAALRHMDAVQGRTGTVTALIDTGRAPAARVPAAPPLPQPVLVPFRERPAGAVPRTVRAAQAESCPDEADRPVSELFTAYDLGRGRTLWEVACGLWAYNSLALLVMSDATGQVTPVMPMAGTAVETTEAIWVNLSVDPAAGTVTQFAKGRGIGDCGTWEAIGWTGSQFVPLRNATLDTCVGLMPGFWPVLYQSGWSW